MVSDENLARVAADGDGAAFEALLERVYDRLYGLCFRLTGTAADAEDLTQDICTALPAKLSSFRGEAKFTTWLYRIAVNAATDRRRRAARYAKATEDWGSWEMARQAESLEARAAQDWLMTAMTALPPDLRDTLALLFDDLTHAEIGAVLGVSEGTVSWRVSKAKALLKDIREQEMGP